MNLLVTAGNTQAPIDRVRCLTNIFTGRTGASIARCAWMRGHSVTLLTSRPDAVHDGPAEPFRPDERWAVEPYRSFDDLASQMEAFLRAGGFDALVHCAAVSDYLAAGVFAPAEGTRFDPAAEAWESAGGAPRMIDRAAGKVKSDEPELWLRLVRAPKLIDRVREPWGFRGVLVKFKLEVGPTPEELLGIAERSRRQSDADLMVANTLDGAGSWALLGPIDGTYATLTRTELPERLVEAVERQAGRRAHG